MGDRTDRFRDGTETTRRDPRVAPARGPARPTRHAVPEPSGELPEDPGPESPPDEPE